MDPGGALFMGSVKDVAEKIIHAIELLGLTRFIAHLDVGVPSHKVLMRTIELYVTQVIPW